MSAPDRIKLAQMSNRRWIEVDFEAKPSPAAVEYIRKAALPVEELRECLDDRYGPETAALFKTEYRLGS